MPDLNSPIGASHVTAPKYRLLQQRPLTGGAAGTSYPADQLSLGSPLGGSGTDPALLAQTEQLMRSPNVSDRYRAIVNLTKMAPADALPRLQALLNTPGQDPQVIQLATQAVQVMSQMASNPSNPGAAQPGYPGAAQPGIPGAAPQGGPAYQPPQASPIPTYNPGVAGPMNPADAAFVMQTAQTDLSRGGDIGVQAVRQIMAAVQANPQLKEQAYNLLLNHVYHKRDGSVTEALKALGSMGNPQLVPYMQMVQRDASYQADTKALAVSLLTQMSTQPQGGPGAASASPTMTPEFVRAMEFELGRGGASGMQAFGQIRAALGPDPRANGPLRQEVVRVMITHIATKYDPTTVTAAIQLLGQMGAREMDALRYLDAVVRNPGQSTQAQQAARAAIQQILASPPTR
ncbi:MAG: hypothetical protein VKS61_16960 [Candidatus Sericytochromatia bacterium]|nr:hypothetical protein [Candidatus Sericytochromatia bacterium]